MPHRKPRTPPDLTPIAQAAALPRWVHLRRATDAAATNVKSAKSLSGDDRNSGAVLTVAEAARHLKISKKTIFRCIKDGRLEAFHVGRAVRISRESVQTFIYKSTYKNRGKSDS